MRDEEEEDTVVLVTTVSKVRFLLIFMSAILMFILFYFSKNNKVKWMSPTPSFSLLIIFRLKGKGRMMDLEQEQDNVAPVASGSKVRLSFHNYDIYPYILLNYRRKQISPPNLRNVPGLMMMSMMRAEEIVGRKKKVRRLERRRRRLRGKRIEW